MHTRGNRHHEATPSWRTGLRCRQQKTLYLEKAGPSKNRPLSRSINENYF